MAMKKRIALLILVMAAGALLAVALVSAQQPPQQPPPPMDPLGDVMFPPELIMGHTRDLGITDMQKSFMRAEIQKSTARFHRILHLPLQFIDKCRPLLTLGTPQALLLLGTPSHVAGSHDHLCGD